MHDNDSNDLNKKVKVVKKMLKKNNAMALGVAVAFTVSSVLTGCSPKKESFNVPNEYVQNGEPTSSPSGGYARGVHGGSYYFSRGSSYRGGSWGSGFNSFKGSNAGSSSYKSGFSGRSGGISG